RLAMLDLEEGEVEEADGRACSAGKRQLRPDQRQAGELGQQEVADDPLAIGGDVEIGGLRSVQRGLDRLRGEAQLLLAAGADRLTVVDRGEDAYAERLHEQPPAPRTDGDTEIKRTADAAAEDAGKGLEILREAERTGDVVGRAGGQHRQGHGYGVDM